ncbi:MAG: AgmX/PglI C-terminal domain-containing protein [Bdellovibrio sp.]
MDKDLIGAVIAKNLGQIRFCYEQGLQLDASLHGRVAVDFTIDASGAVKLAQVQSSSLNSKQVEDCMVLRLKGWKFPLPENGKDVKVSYPFVLRRSGQG